MRKIVQIKTIDEIIPIENADRIEIAKIGGWKSIVGKGDFKVGDKVLYFEIDTVLPEGIQEFERFVDKSSRNVTNPNGTTVRGHVLRTMKMRGEFSQGLILPLSFGLNEESTQEDVDNAMSSLGVFKYEPPIPMGGDQIGVFPDGVRKTDSERVQNITDEFLASLDPEEWFATEKIDGTSSTFIKRDGQVRVAGRNWELHPDNSLQGKIAKRFNLDEIMPEGSIIQAEVFGDGIQKNKLKVQGTQMMIFYSFSPVEDDTFNKFVKDHSVPPLDLEFPKTVEQAIEQVNGMVSALNPKVQAEGVVWWNRESKEYPEIGDRPNFKAINNKFLAKHGE